MEANRMEGNSNSGRRDREHTRVVMAGCQNLLLVRKVEPVSSWCVSPLRNCIWNRDSPQEAEPCRTGSPCLYTRWDYSICAIFPPAFLQRPAFVLFLFCLFVIFGCSSFGAFVLRLCVGKLWPGDSEIYNNDGLWIIPYVLFITFLRFQIKWDRALICSAINSMD